MVALAGAVLAPGCRATVDSRIVADDADGTTVELPLGSALEVRLVSNASTGYRWSVAPGGLPALLELTTDGLYAEPERSTTQPRVGAPGVQVFVFTARRAGSATLRLVYGRPWEPGMGARQFELQVVVR